MGGNDGSQIPLLHVSCKNAFYRLTHHRVKPVKGLITEQIIRARTHTADHRHLLFHALGKCIDFPSFIQLKGLHQMVKPLPVKLRIYRRIKRHHFLRRCIAEKILVVGYIEKSGFYLDILIYFLFVYGYRALIRLQDPT